MSSKKELETQLLSVRELYETMEAASEVSSPVFQKKLGQYTGHISGGNGEKLQTASEASARARFLLSRTPDVVRKKFSRVLGSVAKEVGLQASHFALLVEAKAKKLSQAFISDEILSSLKKSGCALLTAVWLLSSGAYAAEVKTSDVLERVGNLVSTLNSQEEPLPPIDKTDIAERSKNDSSYVRESLNLPKSGIHYSVPALSEVWNGVERYQGTQSNCTFYAIVRAIEAAYDAKIYPASAPENLSRLFSDPRDSETAGRTTGATFQRAIRFAFKALNLPEPQGDIELSEKSFDEQLHAGNVILMSVADPYIKAFTKYGKTLEETLYDKTDALTSGYPADTSYHAVAVLGHVVTKDINAYIVADSNPWQPKGLKLVTPDILVRMGVGAAFAVSPDGKARPRDAFDVERDFDPVGKDIGHHRSLADQAVAMFRVDMRTIAESARNLIGPQNGAEDVREQAVSIARQARGVDSRIKLAADYFNKNSGSEIAIENSVPLKVASLLEKGLYAQAADAAGRFDEWFVPRIAGELLSAGNVLEAKRLETTGTIWESMERISGLFHHPFNRETARALRSVNYNDAYNEISALERRLAGDDSPEIKVMRDGLAQVKRKVAEEFEKSRAEGYSDDSNAIRKLYASAVENPVHETMVQLVLNDLGKDSPDLAKQRDIASNVSELKCTSLAELRTAMAKNPGAKEFWKNMKTVVDKMRKPYELTAKRQEKTGSEEYEIIFGR